MIVIILSAINLLFLLALMRSVARCNSNMKKMLRNNRAEFALTRDAVKGQLLGGRDRTKPGIRSVSSE